VSVEDGRTPVSLADYLSLLRRRKWVFLATAFLVPAIAVAVSLKSPPTYLASVKVLLNQNSTPGASQGAPADPARTAQTQANVARGLEVAQGTVNRAHVPGLTPASLLDHSSVVADLGSDFLTFSVTNSDPDVAKNLVGAYADEYVANRHESDTKDIAEARALLELQMKRLEAAGLAASPEYALLEQQLAELGTAAPKLDVYPNPYGPVQVGPRVKRNAGIAVVLGLILGVTLAFLWDILDTRVRSVDTVRNALQRLRLLGRLPTPPRALRRSDRLVMLTDPTSVDAEPLRVLRANFEFAVADVGARTIMVTSGVGGEGKSTTVANLAVALARSGRRVILVDFDLRKPGLHSLFGLEGMPGLIDVTVFDARLETALASIPLTDFEEDGQPSYQATGGSLQVLPLGTMLHDPDRLQTEVLGARIVDSLKDRADYVLIDAGPILPTGDTIALSAHVDAIVLVVRLNGLPRGALDDLGRVLASAPAAKLGFVLTGDDASLLKLSQHSGSARRATRMNGSRGNGSGASSSSGHAANGTAVAPDADVSAYATDR
jgi:polysaccharide biosynthesis transport protein